MFEKIKQILQKIHDWLIREEQLLINVHFFKKIFIAHHANNYRPHITHHHTLAVFMAILITGRLMITGFLMPMDTAYGSGISATDLVQMTNNARGDFYLPPLKINTKLVEAAEMKAKHMFEHQYWSHTSPDGVTPWYWFDEISYVYEHAGENLARDFHSSDGVFEGWRNSRAHWDNIVNNKFKEIGIAVVPGVFDGKPTTIVVQFFGTAKQNFQTISTQPTQKIFEEKEAVRLSQPIIDYPNDGDYLNKNYTDIRGRADKNVKIEILDDNRTIGKIPTDTAGSYSFRSPTLEDGEHRIKAISLKDDYKSDYSTEVKFYIDTISPIINQESVDISYNRKDGNNIFTVIIEVLDNPTKVEILSENNLYSMVRIEENIWGGILEFDEFTNDKDQYDIMIYAVDDAKNSAVLEYRLEIVEEVDSIVLNNSIENTKLSELLQQKLAEVESLENNEDLSAEKIEIIEQIQEREDSRDEDEMILSISDENISGLTLEKSQATASIDWIHYFKMISLSLMSLLFFAFVLQAYVIYHRGIHDERYHPIFHAVSVLCIMVVIVIS
jgi:hypothetical protein